LPNEFYKRRVPRTWNSFSEDHPMDRTNLEHTFRPIGAGLVVLLTLLLLLGIAIRDPRPHDIPVGLAVPPPVAQQLTAAFGQNAPGAFALTEYSSEADARAAIDDRDVVAALVAGPAGMTLVVAGAAGDAIAGGVTAAFSGAFQAQGTPLTVETVHPYVAGDPHGIILFFLVLATLISSVVAGALTGMMMPGAGWATRVTVLAVYAIGAGVIGTATAAWLANGYGDGIWAAMALVALLSLAVSSVVAASARLLGAAGVGLSVLVVVLLGLVSSGGPLGRAFLPDTYRAIAPWLPVEPAIDAIRGALFFGGAGITTPVIVLVVWAMVGIAGIALLGAREMRRPAETRIAPAHA
jgi:hypothetical protein